MERRPHVRVHAAPLASQGDAYRRRGIPVAMTGASPPSGGFPAASVRVWLGDLHTWPRYVRYLVDLRRQIRPGDRTVAVGDTFIAGIAHAAVRHRTAHVAVAKSDWGTPHSRLDVMLLGRWTSVVFTRDDRTAATLANRRLRACFLGNPLADGLPAPPAAATARSPHVALLPGSRAEAARNLHQLLDVVRRLEPPVDCSCAWPPSRLHGEARAAAAAAGWQTENGVLQCGARRVRTDAAFEDVLASATVVLGLSGTANEQAAALGLPVVTFVGCGPQTTRTRMQEQQRLLGAAVEFVDGPPADVAAAVSRLLSDPDERRRRGAAGIARMGPAGGAGRIADRLLQEWAW